MKEISKKVMKLNDRPVGKTDWALLLVMSAFVFMTDRKSVV